MPVDGEDLVTAFKFSMFRGGPRFKHGLHVNGHVSVRAAKAADNRKPKTLISSNQFDRLGRAVGHGHGWDGAATAFVSCQGKSCRRCCLLLSLSASKASNFHQDFSLCHLEDGSGFLLRAVGQVVAVHRDNLKVKQFIDNDMQFYSVHVFRTNSKMN